MKNDKSYNISMKSQTIWVILRHTCLFIIALEKKFRSNNFIPDYGRMLSSHDVFN